MRGTPQAIVSNFVNALRQSKLILPGAIFIEQILCCRIGNILMLEIISDSLGAVLSTSQIRPDLLHHFRLSVRALPPHRIRLDVLIEKFVRIQLRTVPRQVEQPEVLSMPMNPAFDLSGTMHRMTIHNQKYLSRVLFDQPPKKVDHHRSGESPSVPHQRHDWLGSEKFPLRESHERLGAAVPAALAEKAFCHRVSSQKFMRLESICVQ